MHVKQQHVYGQNRYFFWVTGGYLFCSLAVACPGSAQISPDGTLPTKITQSNNQFEITGGEQAGGNLFHSFLEFSVPTGSIASFRNASGIENIISRVTGKSVSNIDGLLQAEGSANFFLLNPNGIIFGPNAELDIGGSFLASTANRLQFADGTEFSTTTSQAPPLLTISVPIGLQFGNEPGSIINRSRASRTTNTFGDPSGLRVQPGQTITLAGGDVVLEGGNLTTSGGRIELGSVAGGSLVSLISTEQNWSLGYEGVQNYQDIQLSQAAAIDTSGAGGVINLQGRRITLIEGSQVSNAVLGEEDGGSLSVNAVEAVELLGVNSSLVTQVGIAPDVTVTGKGGDLTIDTQRLIVRDGGVISSGTLSQGKAGNLRVSASEFVELTGSGTIFIEFLGVSTLVPSTLLTSTQGEGAGGALTINTQRLIVRDGAQLQASTFGDGNGGTLTINASESIELSGATTLENGNLLPSNLSASSGQEGLPPPFQATGNGGDIRINTRQLTVQQGAEVTVSSLGSGDAGNLDVTARSISLNQQGGIIATTTSGQGGNINLQGLNTLVLRDNSQISTTAGSIGSGGDIAIDTDFLVAVENSDITANALQGQGGNIQLNAIGLFLAPDSAITASSQFGLDGIVEVTSPEVDAATGLVDLPEETTDPSQQIVAGCASTEGSQFVVTGRGGLPPTPNARSNSIRVWGDMRNLSAFRGQNTGDRAQELKTSVTSPEPSTPPGASATGNERIVEAKGWVMNGNGQVKLVATSPLRRLRSPWSRQHACTLGASG